MIGTTFPTSLAATNFAFVADSDLYTDTLRHDAALRYLADCAERMLAGQPLCCQEAVFMTRAYEMIKE